MPIEDRIKRREKPLGVTMEGTEDEIASGLRMASKRKTLYTDRSTTKGEAQT